VDRQRKSFTTDEKQVALRVIEPLLNFRRQFSFFKLSSSLTLLMAAADQARDVLSNNLWLSVQCQFCKSFLGD